jgi:hypothetical protein
MYSKLCSAVLVTCALHLSAGIAEAQTEEQIAARIMEFGGVVERDDEGNIMSVGMLVGTDTDLETLDFSKLSSLRFVSLLGRDMTNRSIVHLRKTIPPCLRGLSVALASISDKELAPLLRKHPALVSVSLDYTSVSDDVLSEIAGLRELHSLTLQGTKITDNGLKTLLKLEQVGHLFLGETAISDIGLLEVAKMPELRVLFIDRTKVTDSGIQHLGRLKALRRLDVSSTKVTENGKNALKRSLPDLQFVDSQPGRRLRK